MSGGELRLSVGMPVYNGESFIGGAIESILGQTFAARDTGHQAAES